MVGDRGANWKPRPRLLTGGRELLLVAALLAATLGLQLWNGALTSERASSSDEAGHFMNGLVLRDYLKDGLGQNPVTFAEHYYVSYPKIAIGMWPPLFHTVLGLFMLLGWPPQVAAVLLLALVNTWAAWRLYTIVAIIDTRLVGLMLAATFVVASASMGLTTAVMLDLPVAALTLEATYRLALFAVNGSYRNAALLGVFTALCCLTKGNGLSMVLVPCLLIVMTRRYDLLVHRGLYLAALIVLVFAAPVVVMSLRLDAAIGDFGVLTMGAVLGRTVYYSAYLWAQLGTLVIGLAVIAIAASARRQPPAAATLGSMLKVALAAQVLAAISFHIFNPHLAIATRYIALAVPPLLALAPVGAAVVSRLVPARSGQRGLQLALVVAAIVGSLLSRPVEGKRVPIGASQTVDFLESHGGLADLRIVVVSDERGEGAMVSEVALRHPMPAATVIRATKLVATDDWSGNHLTLLYSSPADLLRRLEDLHVRYLVVDRSRNARGMPFWTLFDELIRTNTDRLEHVYSTTTARSLETYRLKYNSPGPPMRVEVPLNYSLGKVLTK
jgi:hypothetical protein